MVLLRNGTKRKRGTQVRTRRYRDASRCARSAPPYYRGPRLATARVRQRVRQGRGVRGPCATRPAGCGGAPRDVPRNTLRPGGADERHGHTVRPPQGSPRLIKSVRGLLAPRSRQALGRLVTTRSGTSRSLPYHGGMYRSEKTYLGLLVNPLAPLPSSTTYPFGRLSSDKPSV